MRFLLSVLVLAGLLCSALASYPILSPVCLRPPYEELLPLGFFPPALEFCEVFYPQPRCTQTVVKYTTLKGTQTSQTTDTTVYVTTATVTLTTATVTQTSTSSTETDLDTTSTETDLVTTSTETDVTTTGTTLVTVTTGTTSTTVFTSTTLSISTFTSTSTSTVISYSGTEIGKRSIAEATAHPLSKRKAQSQGELNNLLNGMKNHPHNFLSTACSCIEAERPCVTSTSTSTVNKVKTTTHDDTATDYVTATSDVAATTVADVDATTTIYAIATTSIAVVATTVVDVGALTTVGVEEVNTAFLVSTTVSVTTVPYTATVTVPLTELFSPKFTDPPNQGCNYPSDTITVYYSNNSPQTNAGQIVLCARDCENDPRCQYFQVSVYDNYSPPALECLLSYSSFDPTKEQCQTASDEVYLNGFGANRIS